MMRRDRIIDFTSMNSKESDEKDGNNFFLKDRKEEMEEKKKVFGAIAGARLDDYKQTILGEEKDIVGEFIKLNEEKVKKVCPFCKNGNTNLSKICQTCKEDLPMMAEYDKEIKEFVKSAVVGFANKKPKEKLFFLPAEDEMDEEV